MPYVDSEYRDRLDTPLNLLAEVIAAIADEEAIIPCGLINFSICRIVHYLFKIWGDYSYSDINDVIGALECAKQEIYRRLAVPYENKKKKQNGDVF